eukprot:scaffold112076_cov30-Tisochrysis_lutea.AAC.2
MVEQKGRDPSACLAFEGKARVRGFLDRTCLSESCRTLIFALATVSAADDAAASDSASSFDR